MRTAKQAIQSATNTDQEDAEHRQSIQDFVYLVLDAEQMIPGYIQKWMFVVGMGDPFEVRLKNARLAMVEFQKVINKENR